MRFSISRLTLFMLLLTASTANAQDFSEVNYPMSAFGSDLDYGFLGGLVNPQFSAVNLNGDAAMDLFVFDKNGSRIYTFIHSGIEGEPSYTHAPEYEKRFPQDIHSWVLLRDYNNDGIQDIFCAPPELGISGIAVFRGSEVNGELNFTRVEFDADPIDIIYFDWISPTSGNEVRSDLYVAVSTDLPAIVDMDGDGDLDILSFEAGGSFIAYYKNTAVEDGLGPEGLSFFQEDGCWGKVKEGGLDATMFLSDNELLCASSQQFHGVEAGDNRHSGSSLVAFDGDGDGDLEVLVSDVGSSFMTFLINDGNPDKAYVQQQEIDYPQSNVGIDVYIFPSAFHLDVDNDGRRDLVVSSSKSESGINRNHIWFYKNVGADDNPTFELESRRFLMNETINIGRYTTPIFLDYDNDGLQDLLVGNSGYRLSGQDSEIGLHLFRNVGSAANPAYDLVDDDYLGFAVLLEFSQRLAPTLGDLDGDGDDDLIVGDNKGKLYYFENIAGADAPLEFAPYIYEYMDIDVGSNALPQIVDINDDGMNDLVIGEFNFNQNSSGKFGQLNYYQNIGEVNRDSFSHEKDLLPNSEVLGGFYEIGDAHITPRYYEKSDGSYDLYTGAEDGKIRVYDVPQDDIYEEYTLLEESFGDIVIGRNTAIDLADIDNDGFLEMIIGNRRGGLDMYNTTVRVDGTDTPTINNDFASIKLFPNPTNQGFFMEGIEDISVTNLYDLSGRLVKSWYGVQDYYPTLNLDNGTYLLQVQTADMKTYTEKLIVMR